jgi:hypothetical protein
MTSRHALHAQLSRRALRRLSKTMTATMKTLPLLRSVLNTFRANDVYWAREYRISSISSSMNFVLQIAARDELRYINRMQGGLFTLQVCFCVQQQTSANSDIWLLSCLIWRHFLLQRLCLLLGHLVCATDAEGAGSMFTTPPYPTPTRTHTHTQTNRHTHTHTHTIDRFCDNHFIMMLVQVLAKRLMCGPSCMSRWATMICSGRIRHFTIAANSLTVCLCVPPAQGGSIVGLVQILEELSEHLRRTATSGTDMEGTGGVGPGGEGLAAEEAVVQVGFFRLPGSL